MALPPPSSPEPLLERHVPEPLATRPSVGSSLTHSRMLLRLCGHPTLLTRDGDVVPLSRKALALLAFLVLEPRAHSRQRLSALLWSETGEANAATSLRQALTKLRAVLGSALMADRNNVWLERNGDVAIACDVLETLETIDEDPGAATMTDVSLFWSEGEVGDAAEFGLWVESVRTRLRKRAIHALRLAARASAAQRDWKRAALLAERWLHLDSLAEDAVTVAVEAAYMRRDSERARALFADYRTRLREEEGSEPGAELLAVIRRLESSIPTPTSARAVPKSGGAAITPRPPMMSSLREREAAWHSIHSAWGAVRREGSAGCVLISGAVGVGRSRLLGDVLSSMASQGATVLAVRLAEGRMTLPYHAIASLVRTALDAPGLGGADSVYLHALSQLVPEVAQRFPGVRRAADQHAGPGWSLADALSHVLRALTDEAAVVIALDDISCCDRESGAVVHAALDALADLPILWLGSIPTDSLQHVDGPLTAVFAARATEVALTPLSVDAVEAMLSDFSGDEDGWRDVAQRLHAFTHGVPLLVCEMVDRLVEAAGNDWTTVRTTPASMPRLPERVKRRIDALTEMENEVLLALALMAEHGHPVPAADWPSIPPLSPDVLSRTHGISRLRAARIGESLIDAGLAEGAQGGFRCAAPIVAHHMLASRFAIRRDELRRRLLIVRGATT